MAARKKTQQAKRQTQCPRCGSPIQHCEHCREPFPYRRQARFCSDKCRVAAHRARQAKRRK